MDEKVKASTRLEQPEDQLDSESRALQHITSERENEQQVKNAIGVSVYENTKASDSKVLKTIRGPISDDRKTDVGNEPFKDESDLESTVQINELSVADINETSTWSKTEAESGNCVSQAEYDILVSEYPAPCDGCSVEKPCDLNMPPPAPPCSPSRFEQTSSNIIITPPSDHCFKVHTEAAGKLFSHGSKEMQGDFHVPVVKTDHIAHSVKSSEADTSLSEQHDTSDCSKCRTGESDTSVDDASGVSSCHEQLLFSTSDETDVDIETEKEQMARHLETKLKSTIDNFQQIQQSLKLKFNQKHHQKREKSRGTDVLPCIQGLEPHESMEEIDLHDENPSQDAEKRSVEPPLPRIEQSKYGDILGHRKVDFLKSALVAKIRDTFNDKLSKLHQETTQASKSHVPTDDSKLPLGTTSELVARLPETNQTKLITQTESSDLCLQNDVVCSPCKTAHQVSNASVNIDALRTENDNHFTPQMQPGPIYYSELNYQNRPFNIHPEHVSPFVHSTIVQSPGPLRGYTTFCPSPYGVPLPPPLPPPPLVPAPTYFASRQYPSQSYASTSIPVIHTAPPAVERNSVPKIHLPVSGLSRGVDYVTSFVRLKSNQIRGNLGRRLSTTESDMPRPNHTNEFFVEEGHFQRSSMDSGSDRFRQRSFHTNMFDEVLKGAACCCCWPFGLAARLFALSFPDRGGPVDACIKAMADQMSSLSLFLGIASYILIFMIWLFLMAASTGLQRVVD